MQKVDTKKKNIFLYQGLSYESLSLKKNKLNHSKFFLYVKVFKLGLIIGLFIACRFLNPNPAFSEVKEEKKGFLKLSVRDKIFGNCSVDNNTYWAVGTMGLIIKTTDGGKTFERLNRITTLTLYDIFFLNEEKGWIVGDGGLILNTEDGGASWNKQQSPTNDPLTKVLFLDENKGNVVGLGGIIYHTENGGRLWQVYSMDWTSLLPEPLVAKGIFAPNLYDIVFVDATHGWIVGEAGVMLKTSDGGKQWEMMDNKFFRPLFSVFFKNQSEGYACGDNGFFIHTQDGGKSWVQLKLPTQQNLFHIFMGDDKFGLIVGERGTALQTTDGGLTWSPLGGINLTLPLPYFSGAWIIKNSSTRKIFLLGEGMFETSILPQVKGTPNQ